MTPPAPLGVVVVEDDPWIAAEISRVLDEAGCRVLHIAATGADALEAVARLTPGLVVMDVELDGALDGVEVGERITASHRTPIVYLTGHDDAETVTRAARTALSSYLLKPFTAAQLRAAVTLALAEVQAAAEAVSPEAAKAHATLKDIVETLRRHGYTGERSAAWESRAVACGLSPRELEVMRQLVTGHRVSSLALHLGISESTVRNHLKAVFQKLGVQSQAELVMWTSKHD